VNVGVFWPRRRVYRDPGLAVIEFLPRIDRGLEKRDFLEQVETVVEANSIRLMADAGFHVEE
jgi:1-acyl-sn-glycerol-3-phosphate acyltransferase